MLKKMLNFFKGNERENNSEKKDLESLLEAPTMVLERDSQDSSRKVLEYLKRKGLGIFTKKESEEVDFGLKPGEELSAGYNGTIIKELGQGAFGKVYLMQSNIEVEEDDGVKPYKNYFAVKVISDSISSKDRVKAVNDLRKEAAVTGSFGGYTYVVNARLLRREGTVIGAIYDYVEGPNLLTLLEKHIDRGLLPPIEISLSLGERILRALETAHLEYNYAHKDVSLDNCMLHAKSGTPRIIDWGTAHKSYDNIATGKIDHMAPEILNYFLKNNMGFDESVGGVKGEVNKLCFETYCGADIFSLGTVVYNLISGTTPFILKDMPVNLALMNRKMLYPDNESINKLDYMCKDVFSEISNVVSEAMEYNPSLRPSTSQMLSKFSHILYGNGQMGFGVTDKTHAKYWQAFERGEDYSYDPELIKLLKSKMRKQIAEMYGPNEPIGRHYSDSQLVDKVGTIYRSFEEAFGQELCHERMLDDLKSDYKYNCELMISEASSSDEKQRIENKFNDMIYNVSKIPYDAINNLFKETSKELLISIKKEKSPELNEHELRPSKKFNEELDKFNNRRKYKVIKENFKNDYK